MIKIKYHEAYISKVTATKEIQDFWKPAIGHIIIANEEALPQIKSWDQRTNTKTFLHALNESDLLFLKNNCKEYFYWVPTLSELLYTLTDLKNQSPSEILTTYITNDPTACPELQLLEELQKLLPLTES